MPSMERDQDKDRNEHERHKESTNQIHVVSLGH